MLDRGMMIELADLVKKETLGYLTMKLIKGHYTVT
jgi:hypothetical protein